MSNAVRLEGDQPVVRVIVPHDVAHNLQSMAKVTASVLGKLGCPACHSGFDIRFLQEREFVVDGRSLEVRSAGSTGT